MDWSMWVDQGFWNLKNWFPATINSNPGLPVTVQLPSIFETISMIMNFRIDQELVKIFLAFLISFLFNSIVGDQSISSFEEQLWPFCLIWVRWYRSFESSSSFQRYLKDSWPSWFLYYWFPASSNNCGLFVSFLHHFSFFFSISFHLFFLPTDYFPTANLITEDLRHFEWNEFFIYCWADQKRTCCISGNLFFLLFFLIFWGFNNSMSQQCFLF